MNQNITFNSKSWKCRNKTFKWSKNIHKILAIMDNVCNNIDDYNPNRRKYISIAFDGMVADIMTN